MADRPIGERLFTDGVTRTLFQGEENRQYVHDADGTPVDGVWLGVEEPMIVERNEGAAQQEGMQ